MSESFSSLNSFVHYFMGLRLCSFCFICFICYLLLLLLFFVHLACEMAWVLGATLRSSVAFTQCILHIYRFGGRFPLARVSTCDARFGSLIECFSLHTELSDNIAHVSAQNGTETGEEETVHSALLSFFYFLWLFLLLLLYLFISIQLRSVFCLCRALWLSLTGFIASFCAVALLIHNAITFD